MKLKRRLQFFFVCILILSLVFMDPFRLIQLGNAEYTTDSQITQSIDDVQENNVEETQEDEKQIDEEKKEDTVAKKTLDNQNYEQKKSNKAQVSTSKKVTAKGADVGYVNASSKSDDSGTYTFNFKADGTAEWRKINATDFQGVLKIPTTADYQGVTYQVNVVYPLNNANAKNVTDIVFPEAVTKIYGNFKGWNSLTNVTIPKHIKAYYAMFWECANLESITFEEGFENLGVKGSGTSGNSSPVANSCPQLKMIHLPNSLENIYSWGSRFVLNCPIESLEFPENVNISETASLFSNCNQLKSIVLPKSVTKIGTTAFRNCTSLTSITAKGVITEVCGRAFYNCSELIEIPDLSNVTKFIYGEEFYGCTKLKTIQLSDNLSEVSWRTFMNCESLDIKLPNTLTKTSRESFKNSGITEVDLSAMEVTELGIGVFADCKNLEKVTVGGNITSISQSAFEGCSHLKEVLIDENVTEIEAKAFYNCSHEDLVITIDNSEDDVNVATGAFDIANQSGAKIGEVKVVYLQKSIDITLGDTIKENGMTLQEAVDALGDNGEGTITIEKDVVLNEPVVIKGNRNVVLTSEQLWTILGKKDTQTIDRLFVIEKGSTLTLKGSLDLNGKYCSQSGEGNIIKVNGKLIIDDQIVIEKSIINNGSAISVMGEGTQLVMNNGTIRKCKVNGSEGAVIRLADGGQFDMYGGEVCDNNINSSYAGGSIYIGENGKFHMHHGAIHDNTLGKDARLYTTGGVVVYGRTSGESHVAKMILDDGDIYNNEGIYGAGIGIYKNSSVVMNGGNIHNNTAKESGGAISVSDQYRIDNSYSGSIKDYSQLYKAEFTMNGGTIKDNKAKLNGGGINVVSNGVTINKGEIINNTAGRQGGGIYVSNEVTSNPGEQDSQYILNISKALVTKNTAENGGGVWICPTGFGKIYGKNGLAIFDNKGTQTGDDLIFVNIGMGAGKKVNGHHLTVDNHILGGGTVTWYKDGGSYTPAIINFLDEPNSHIPRYTQQQEMVVDIDHLQTGIGLKSIVSEKDQQLGKDAAQVTISGNTARSGGGIGSNGGFQSGEEAKGTLTMSKSLVGIEKNKLNNHGEFKVALTTGSSGHEIYYDKDGNASSQKTYITVTVGETVTVSNLYEGEYQVREVRESAQQNGYALKVAGEGTVRVSTQEVAKVSLENTYIQTKVSIRKVDNNNQAVVGARLSIIDNSGAKILTFTTGKNAYEIIGKLNAGQTYILREEQAPTGYERAKDVKFKVSENDEVTNVKMVDLKKPEISTVKASLILYKINQDEEYITGATFKLVRVINGTENTIGIQSGGPRYEFKNLSDGTYRVYETIAPSGYEGLPTYFEIQIKSGKIYYDGAVQRSFKIINTNDGSVPSVLGDEIDSGDYSTSVQGREIDTHVNTSDNQNYVIYGVLLLTSIVGLIVLSKRKKIK